VAYVDTCSVEGEKEGYVRFKDAASASKTVDHTWPHYQFSVLTGQCMVGLKTPPVLLRPWITLGLIFSSPF
jgi:hypothetical protein